MEKVTMYKALDGELFSTEAECIKHDNFIKAYNKISEIYSKYSKVDKKYDCVYTEMPDFIKDIADNFGFELHTSEIIVGVTYYGFEPRFSAPEKDSNIALEAWSKWYNNHILPW